MKQTVCRFNRITVSGIALLATMSLFTVPAFAAVAADGDTLLLHDDFDSYTPGTLPPGWDIVWSGAGYDLQAVSDTQAYSGSNSFRLLGQPYWSAVAESAIASDSTEIGYEFKILIESVGRWGEEHPAFFSYQAEGNRWGTYYAAVRFDHRTRAILAEDGTLLGRWNPQTWYSVRVILDRNNNTYDVSIDGAQVGFDLAIKAQSPKLINALALMSGHAGVPVYYDDVAAFTPGSDSDGDGIPDSIDPCPDVNPGLIDINVDGCVDTSIVIAAYLNEGISPVADELPDSAMACVEGALVNLEIEALAASVEDMLCVVENLEPVGTQAAIDAEYLTGICAQTTALLAIDQAAQVVGDDDPNVISATTLVELGMELLEQLKIPAAVSNFLDAIDQLFDPPKPNILVEVQHRNAFPTLWEKNTYTFAEWGELVVSTIRITNTGNVDLTDVRVWQTWSDFRKDVGALAVGESVVLNEGGMWTDMIPYRVRQFDPDPFIMVSVGVGQHRGQLVKSSATCEVDIIHPQITLTVKAPRSMKVGEMASFEFTVTNTGDVVLHDTRLYVPGPLRFWEYIGEMAPGDSRFFPVHYLVPDYRKDEIKFRARAMGRREVAWASSWEEVAKWVEDSKFIRIRIIRD